MAGAIVENPVVKLPHEIMAMVFRYLPTEDIKSVALVSRTWKAVTQHHKFWTNVLMKISRYDIEEKLQSERLGVIGRVQLVEDLTADELESVLVRLEDFKQRNPNPPDQPLRVENEISNKKATSTIKEVVSLLLTIAKAIHLELRLLSLVFHNLSSVKPEILAQAVVRVADANLACTQLTDKQMRTVLSTIVSTQNLPLKHLSILGNNISLVPPDLLAQAAIKLENPNHIMPGASKEQILAICNKIVEVDREDLRIKKLDISYYRDIYPISEDILSAINLKTELRGYSPVTGTDSDSADGRPRHMADSEDSEDSDFISDSDSENLHITEDSDSESENS